MKRIGYSSLAFLAAIAVAGSIASAAFATPSPIGAVVLERVFNDCPISTVTSVNNYPASITIDDSWNGLCIGWANAHAWKFTTDGITPVSLGNNGNYKFGATVVLNATSGTVEGGLNLAPWWGAVDGHFQARIPDGEVACFGGRLPFYSFTANHGVVYVAGTPIHMEIEYHANGLSAISPATIEYRVTYGANNFTSGPIAFDQGNPAEDPPHGQWGALDPSTGGGFAQVNNGSNGSNYHAEWNNISFTCFDCATPAQNSTWGRLKALYR